MDISEAEDYIARLSPAEIKELDKLLIESGAVWDWNAFARPEQLAPKGDWLTWLALAGRGWGKTRCGAEWVRAEVTSKRAKRFALIAETQKDLEEVMCFGESGI